MEKLKVQISEVEGITLKIPSEFSPYAFKKFYDQMLAIGKMMPNNPLAIDATPERFRSPHWQNQEENLTMLKLWEEGGKDVLVSWLKTNKGMELTPQEYSKLSGLMANFRTKYKKVLTG